MFNVEVGFQLYVCACVYRPPGTVTSTFTDQLPVSDLFDQLQLMDIPLVALGDFNVLGFAARQLDRRATDVFHQHGLQQHVTTSTRGDPASGNILDLILTSDDQPSGQLVSEVTVHSVCFSNHRLVKCRLGVPPTPPTIVTYSYR